MKKNKNIFLDGLKKDIKNKAIDGIIDSLPDMLKTPCGYLVEEVEKEVFLIGAIGVVSGILPNLKGHYAGKYISPNLFVYVLAGYGGGKGGLDYAMELGKQVHQAKKDEAKKLMIDYQNEEIIYQKEIKLYNRSKNKEEEPPAKPFKPPILMLYIPANNSKSGIYQLLSDNDEKGIIFETEGDTLTDALKQDFGGFSDILRKSFHHEKLTMFRRKNNEEIEIVRPQLSVVLSSTFDQLRTLIPSVENGLYSRFLYYQLKQDNKFIDVFDNRKANYQTLFNDAGVEFKQLHDILQQQETPTWFKLNEEQMKRFVEVFDIKKEELIADTDVTMAGTANRLGIIAYRIMMILTALRAYKEGVLNNAIECKNIDFENALVITNRLEKHAKTVHQYLLGNPNKKELAIEMKIAGSSIRDISKALDVNRGTLSKWFKNISKK